MINFYLQDYLDVDMENYFHKKLPYESLSSIKVKISELLKFLLLSRFYKSNIPFSVSIDEIWHLWILETKQYLELMKKLPDNKFIHHSSNQYNGEAALRHKEEGMAIKKKFSYFVSYVFNFGCFTEDTIQYYPMAIKIMALEKMSLKEFNQYLVKIGKDNLS